jgi:hypothetical protein
MTDTSSTRELTTNLCERANRESLLRISGFSRNSFSYAKISAKTPLALIVHQIIMEKCRQAKWPQGQHLVMSNAHFIVVPKSPLAAAVVTQEVMTD